MIDENFLKKMFNLPQETHPEKLWVLKYVPAEAKIIYDLGCGSKKTVENAIGVDIKPGSDKVASMDFLPFIENQTVDIVVFRHSLEHMLDPVKTLKEWWRILKNDGKIIIILPDSTVLNTMNIAISRGQHLHAYTPDSFKSLISLFPEFYLEKIEVVIDEWSFEAVLQKKYDKKN